MPQAAGFVIGMVGFAAPAIGSSMFGGWVAGAAFGSTLIGTIASKLLTTVAWSALTYALQSRPKTNTGGGIKTSSTLTGEANPETIILGWTATAGQAICPPMSHGKDNRYLTHVIELCSAPGATLERLVINNEFVTLGTEAHPDYGLPVTSGEHAGLIWVKYYDGRQTAADPMLVANYGAHPDRPWSSEMIGAGICYAILTFRYDKKKLTSVPRYLFEMRGLPVYDPRRDSTAGGSGAHRWADPATWAQSANPIVIAYNVMRGLRLPGGDVWGGKIETGDLPMSVWIAAMNVCDVAIDDGAGGTEAQYRCGTEASLSDAPADLVEELLKSASAQIADVAGTWKVRAGAPSLPVAVIADSDIIVSKEATLDPFPALDATYNGITATFPSPEALWQSKDAPARYNAAWEAQDRFGRKVVDIQLPSVPYALQVQRLMRAWIEDQRRFRVHKFTLPPARAALEPLDCIAWASTKNGYESKLFEISETVDDLMTCLQGEALREVDPTDYSWEPGFELPSVPSQPGYTPPAAEALAGWDVAAVTIDDATGKARRAALQLGWDGAILADGVEWQIRVQGSAQVQAGSTQAVEAGGARVSEGILPETTYEARGRAIVDGRETAWTAWDSATTDQVSVTLEDLEQDLRDWLEEMQDWIDGGGSGSLPAELAALADQIAAEQADRVADAQLAAERWRKTRETVRALQAQAVELASASHAARDEIRRSLAVQLGDLRAAYDEQIVTLADADMAAVLRIETLEVTAADSQARIQQVAQAQVDGDEALAALITGLAVGNATQFDQARIWYFDTTAEGWTGAPSDPVAVAGGLIRPANGAGGYIISPDGLAVDAARYSQVRLRVERTGTPAWTGYLWWAGASEGWSTARRVAIAEPVWAADEGMISIVPGWSGSIDRIRLDLADNTASDSVAVDWIAIGRPAPGASSADLSALQQAMTDADEALAQDVVQLQAELTDQAGAVSGLGSALSGLQSRVTATEDGIEVLSEDMTALQSRVSDPATGLDALADAIDQIATETQSGDGSQLVQSAAIRALTSQLRALRAEGIEGAARDHLGRQDLRDYIAQASQSLSTRIELTDEQVTIVAEAVTALKAAIPGLATADALQALRTVVTQQGDSISANSTWLTSLQAGLDNLTTVVGGKATSSALNALTARVSDVEGDISAQADAYTALNASVGQFAASGLFRIGVEATPSGALSRIGLQASATAAEATSARSAAMFMEAVPGGKSRVAFVADQFVIQQGGVSYLPFIVDGGVVYINTARIKTASIDGAAITDLTVDTLQVKNGALTDMVSVTPADVSFNPTNGSWLNIYTLSISGVATDKALLALYYRIRANNAAPTISVSGRTRITFNGVQLPYGARDVPKTIQNGEALEVSYVQAVNLVAGTNTLAIQFAQAADGTNGLCLDISMGILKVKR